MSVFTATIPTNAIGKLSDLIGKANKICQKLDLPAIELKVLKTENKFSEDHKLIQMSNIEVIGDSPKVGNWELVGTLEPITDENGNRSNLVRNVPNCQVPSEYRTIIGKCDHCQLYRNRSQTFVLKSENEYKCVGRTCLRDFLGHTSIESLVAIAEFWLDLVSQIREFSDSDNVGGKWAMPVVEFLSKVSSVVKTFGFTSKRKAEENLGTTSTATIVSSLIFDKFSPWKRDLAFLPENREEAVKVIEWIKSLDNPESDYLYNLQRIAMSGYVQDQTIGLASSMLTAYHNTHKPEALNNSDWIGTVGEKMETVLKCLKITPLHSQWGTSGLHKLIDSKGNQVAWFASGAWLEEGEECLMSFRVKEHDIYRGIKQTNVSHLKKVVVKAKKEKKVKV